MKDYPPSKGADFGWCLFGMRVKGGVALMVFVLMAVVRHTYHRSEEWANGNLRLNICMEGM